MIRGCDQRSEEDLKRTDMLTTPGNDHCCKVVEKQEEGIRYKELEVY